MMADDLGVLCGDGDWGGDGDGELVPRKGSASMGEGAALVSEAGYGTMGWGALWPRL